MRRCRLSAMSVGVSQQRFGQMVKTLLFLVIGAFLAAESASAQEWTRFRGPNGTGLGDATLPVQWTEKDYNWKVELPGVGHSSPILWGEKICVTAGEAPSGKRI